MGDFPLREETSKTTVQRGNLGFQDIGLIEQREKKESPAHKDRLVQEKKAALCGQPFQNIGEPTQKSLVREIIYRIYNAAGSTPVENVVEHSLAALDQGEIIDSLDWLAWRSPSVEKLFISCAERALETMFPAQEVEHILWH